MTETAYDHLLYEVDDEKICWLTLNRPECLNAFNAKLVSELCHGLERAEHDDRVNTVVIRGAGRGFSSGHDLKEDAGDDFKTIYDYRNAYNDQQHEFMAAWRISKPVIASVHYCAIGKGFELALFCDITIVTSDTRLGYNEMRYGIAGMSMVMPWLVDMKTAKDLMLTGREVTAAEAKTMGLVTQVVEPDELEAATLKKARLVAAMPSTMQRAHKLYLNRIYELQGIKSATDWYQDMQAMLTYNPSPEYERFQKTTLEKGLKPALAEAQKKYEGLD